MKWKRLTCDLVGCKRRKEISVGLSGQRIYYCPVLDTIIGEGACVPSECLKTRPQLLKYWEKEDLLGIKILESLKSGPKSVREIAASIGVKPEIIGLKIKRELESLGIIKYNDNRKKWELNL